MNKLQKVMTALLSVSVCWSQSAQSQDNATKASPVEFFACNFVKGKDLKDVEKVAESFAKWSKENDGNAFGKGQDAWVNSDGKIAGDFAKVMDCSSRHEMATSVPINAPDTPPGDGVLMISQCSVNEGKTMADSYEAHMKVQEILGPVETCTSPNVYDVRAVVTPG